MLIKIYDENPNTRDVRRVADCILEGGIAVLPTDSLYAFVCSMQHKQAVEKLARLKGFSLKQAKFALLCADISQLSEYVRPLDKETFALLKSALPGAPTFIMDANNNVGRNYQNANKTIGMRVPANPICHAIIEEVGEPLIGTSVRVPDADYDEEYLTDPELIHEMYSHMADIVVDGGIGDTVPSTVVNCSGGNLEVIRQGKGEVEL
jgi:tRNA threonylcarbamoyl adenosine modification protein (Sua5/YciO/YrdC/YwlC family)